MKFVSYLLTTACILLTLTCCSIQKAPGAYEEAKGKSVPEKKEKIEKPQEKPEEPIVEEKIVIKQEEPTPTVKPVTETPVETPVEKEETRAEQFVVVDAPEESVLKDYNVVIGSFGKKENATGLKEKMTNDIYKPVIVLNDRGMYRVILATFDEYKEAKAKIAEIKGQFADAWVLVEKK